MSRAWTMFCWSLSLDLQLLFQVKGIPFFEKLFFILLKYSIYLKNIFFGWTDGVSSAVVFGARFYYNEAYGISSLQRVYCEHHHLRSIVPVGSIVVDIGANIGQFNFFSRHYLRAGRVISVEPLPEIFKILLLNTAEAGDCHQYALSDQAGVRKMFVSTLSSSLSSYIPEPGTNSGVSCNVHSLTLDDFVAEIGINQVSLLKIDTEGSEYDVLISGVQTLAVCTLVAIEMSVMRPSSGDIFRTGSLLRAAGFKLVELAPHPDHTPSAVDGLFVKSD